MSGEGDLEGSSCLGTLCQEIGLVALMFFFKLLFSYVSVRGAAYDLLALEV